MFRLVAIPPALQEVSGESVPRAVIAEALALSLFDDLLARVPTGRAYTERVAAKGGRVTYDHGALRTVAGPETGALPSGDTAFARILEPLGYRVQAVYPLDRIKMTGRAYTHEDYPEDIPLYFLSELHPERFSPAFQEAVARVLRSSRDPLTAEAREQLSRLEAEGALPLEDAIKLVPVLAGCFTRVHDAPALADYEALRAESAEMAWIATEGNAFNHATDRVADVAALADAERAQGQPIKDSVEVSSTGRVRQTAYRAEMVNREFVDAEGKTVNREVPGSFYEFISRDPLPDGEGLDLGFDAANAQGIFKMTAAN
ncbi:MAG TPA: DUF1338 domain-containing protein [Alphaproteobacteria bacterium]|nr:DUF1338 domain-containing protein [Alphaproteobacteria bacterium]